MLAAELKRRFASLVVVRSCAVSHFKTDTLPNYATVYIYLYILLTSDFNDRNGRC